MSTHRMLSTLALTLALVLTAAAAASAQVMRFDLAWGGLAVDADEELKLGLANGGDGALALIRGESVVDRVVYGDAQEFDDAELYDGGAVVLGNDGGDVLVVTIDPRALALVPRCP